MQKKDKKLSKKKGKVSGTNTTKTKKLKDVESDSAEFELLGNVFLIETLKGKEVRRTEIPGDTVLKCLLFVLSSGIGNMEKEVGK